MIKKLKSLKIILKCEIFFTAAALQQADSQKDCFEEE